MVKRLTDWLVAAFVRENENLDDPNVRAHYGFLEAWISIVGNIILSVIKVILGIALNSVSLLADAAHTISDVATSVVVLVGFYAAQRRPDKEHPFGHGRIEFMATLVIALLLAVVGIEFGRTSIDRLINGSTVTGSLPAAFIMLVSSMIKELMAKVSIDLGQRINSSALMADAWHHRSDAIASALVAVAMVAARYGYHSVDSILGLVVSALIIYTAWELGSSAGSSLMGEAPTGDLVHKIITLAQSVPNVLGVHDVAVHDYGFVKAISLHIVVSENMSFPEAHTTASHVEEKIQASVGGTVVVHVDPNNGQEKHGLLLTILD
ncbi:MAG: cation transporter [Firmicutes bacterium]|nr:cation transporter [Bacillota bacterium]